MMTADEVKISQVIYNFLSNAFKHTPDGKKITIRAFEKNDWIQVEVEDEGEGNQERRSAVHLGTGITRLIKNISGQPAAAPAGPGDRQGDPGQSSRGVRSRKRGGQGLPVLV